MSLSARPSVFVLDGASGDGLFDGDGRMAKRSKFTDQADVIPISSASKQTGRFSRDASSSFISVDARNFMQEQAQLFALVEGTIQTENRSRK
jgi:hypothetical protein